MRKNTESLRIRTQSIDILKIKTYNNSVRIILKIKKGWKKGYEKEYEKNPCCMPYISDVNG